MSSRIKRITDIHYKAMAHRLQGLKYEEIARIVNRKEGTVRNWFADSVFQEAFAQFQSETVQAAKERLIGSSEEAAKTLINLLKSKVPFESLGAAKDILDRIGLKPTEKQEVDLKGEMGVVIRDDVPKGE